MEWIRGTTYDTKEDRPTALNGKYPVLTFQEVIDTAKARSKVTGRAPLNLNTYSSKVISASRLNNKGTHPFKLNAKSFVRD